MASCVCFKCNKELNDLITVKKDSNKKLFETLFKDADGSELTVCKSCLWEIAEFLNEEDFVYEIPESWMQDDIDTVKQEDFDIEQEIPRYDIVAYSAAGNLGKTFEERATKNDLKLVSKKNDFPNADTAKFKENSILNARHRDHQVKEGNESSELETNSFDVNHSPGNQSYIKTYNENKNAVTAADISCNNSLNNDNATSEVNIESNVLYYGTITDSSPSSVEENLHEHFLDQHALRELQLELGIFSDDTQSNVPITHEANIESDILSYEATDDNVDASSFVESAQQENLSPQADIPTYEIDDESNGSSSVECIEETYLENQNFQPPQNIAEDSLESIDNKEDINVLEIQTDDRATTQDDNSRLSINENHNASCNMTEQMRILEEFEKQCEVIEQRLVSDQNEDSRSSIIEILDDDMAVNEGSSNCPTIRFNANSCNSSDQEVFICAACGQISDQMWKIQEHIAFGVMESACKDARIEKQKLEFAICCEHCGLFFRRSNDLQAHRATGIHSDFLFNCTECSKCFKNYSTLTAHSKTHETPRLKFNPMFMCNVGNCVKICVDWSLLAKHKERSHVAQICPICREEFHDGRFFRTHIRNCKDNQKCAHCVTKFHSSCSRSITTHEKYCLSQIFDCDKCDLRFKSSTSLNGHKTMYHQPADCKICGKIFRSKRAAIGHWRHCNEKSLAAQ